MTLFELMAKISLDSSQYEKGIKDANKSAKGAQEQNETLVNKIKVLQSQYQTAGKRVEELTKKFNESVSKTGAASDETQELAKELEKAEREAEDARKALDKYNDEVDQTDEKTSKATGGLSKFASGLGKGLAGAAKIGVAAIGAASTAIIGLGKIGLDYNKQMETYTTNFEVMMGDAEAAAKKVEELKEMGAKTPFELGDLANATQTLLAFNVSADDSTGVLQKLGDISLGNAQKLESLTRAYGKMNASQKVSLEDINMMIDAGFNPLLLISEKTGESMTDLYDRVSKGAVSFEEMEEAITAATSAGGQFYQGMAKASQTTEGLISTLKDNATALVGEVYQPISQGLTKTVLPAAIDAIGKLSEAFKKDGVEGMIAAAGEMLGGLVNTIVEYAPKVVDMAVTLVESLIQGLSDNQESIAMGAVQIITTLATGILEMLPQIIQLGLDLIVSLANGIAQSLPTLIPTIIDVILQIVNTLTNPETLSTLMDAAIAIIFGLADGLIQALPGLIDQLPVIIQNLVDGLINNTDKMLRAGLELVVQLAGGLIKAIPNLVRAIPQIITSLVKGLAGYYSMIFDVGKDIVGGLKNGISNAWNNLVKWFKGLFGDLIGIAKKILGIASPSKAFAKLGGFTAEGFGVGFEDEFAHVKDDMEKAMAFDDVEIGANIHRSGSYGSVGGGNTFGNVNITVNGANYSSEQSLAQAIAQEIQNMTDRRIAVYA